MIRQRRPPREIAFSFDSFLDVVANVVGIIIRLILVAWVGARSYKSITTVTRPAPAQTTAPSEAQPIQDPLEPELAQHRRELALAQDRLLQQLRQLGDVKAGHLQLEQQLKGQAERRQSLEQLEGRLNLVMADGEHTSQTAALSVTELRERRQKLLEDIRAVEKLPPLKRVLRYRTPVSRPVHAEEFFFECRAGRVSFVDIASFLAEVHQGLEEKAKALRTTWEVAEVTAPVGVFRLRYVVEREHGVLDAVVPGAGPGGDDNFRYGLSEWVVEPLTEKRGESLTEALAEKSVFRQVADRIDSQQGVVTFWVYPDSFALYRQLRDYLYDHDLVVAGRPLPDGVPIASSRHGSVSRGQ